MTLPSPSNQCLWYGSEKNCQLHSVPNPSLQIILSRCRTALAQERYGWRLDQALQKLAEILQASRVEANKRYPPSQAGLIHSVTQGDAAQNITRGKRATLILGSDWILRVDFNRQLKFPTKITSTTLWSDIVLWSTTSRYVVMAERKGLR